MHIEDHMKKEMKLERLEGLKRKYFALEMDLKALEAVGDEETSNVIRERLEGLKKAYAAVEAI
jgi:hypothetical protein